MLNAFITLLVEQFTPFTTTTHSIRCTRTCLQGLIGLELCPVANEIALNRIACRLQKILPRVRVAWVFFLFASQSHFTLRPRWVFVLRYPKASVSFKLSIPPRTTKSANNLTVFFVCYCFSDFMFCIAFQFHHHHGLNYNYSSLGIPLSKRYLNFN